MPLLVVDGVDGAPPDLVLSGINRGANAGEDGTDLAWLSRGYASVTPIHAVGEDPGLVIDLEQSDSGGPVRRGGGLERGR